MFGLIGIKEHASFVVGVAIFCVIMPVLGPIVGSAVLWEAVDRGFRGKELSGLLMSKIAPGFNKLTHKFNARFMKHPEDSFMINCILSQGVVVPTLFMLSYWYTKTHGFSVLMCFLYHVVRIGPYFMQFAYYYTLCHKEGHSRTGLYAAPYNNVFMKNIFNWWISLFFGVMPAAFAFGHSFNHHKYNNGPKDVVTTGDKPRDSVVNFMAYICRWTLYSLNISSVLQFLEDGNVEVAMKMVYGCLYWYSWLAAWCCVDTKFALGYVLYPVFENIMLLCCINWSWHAFSDPTDPEDEYVASLTLLDGPINVLNEDYHVVHHTYPGIHWSDHPAKVKAHWEEYIEHRASVFRGTHAFEMFFLVVLGAWDELAKKFVDLKGEKEGKPMSHEEKIKLLQSRVRNCTWGPRTEKAANKKAD